MLAPTLLRNGVRIYNPKSEATVRSWGPPSHLSLHTAFHPSLRSTADGQSWHQALLPVDKDWQTHTSRSGIYPGNLRSNWGLRCFEKGPVWCYACGIFVVDVSPHQYVRLMPISGNSSLPLGWGKCHFLDSLSRKCSIWTSYTYRMLSISHKPIIFLD